MRRARRAGFTIIEILIAIVVLVLGITGIVALFPTAIESGNKTVEDTYAATITQSVVDAISVGLRESRYTWTAGASFALPAGAPSNWTYFVFNHDGVLDKPPSQPEAFENGGLAGDKDEVWNKDYCVVLPQSTKTDNIDGSQEPFFAFPVPHVDSSAKGEALNKDQRMPEKLGGLIVYDNFKSPDTDRQTAEGTKALWFTRVYQLGRQRNMGSTPPADVGKIRPEYRAEDISGGGTSGDENVAVDPYPTYSFAFAIKRARIDSDANGIVDGADRFTSSLYEVRIYVFKNFSPTAAQALATPEGGGTSVFPPVPKTNVPLRTFITLISL